jgi:peptidyl-prolyl cis-trans isomerase A (cyclophilin A)
MPSVLRKIIVIVAVLVAAYLLYDIVLKPRVLFFQSWEGTLEEGYRVHNAVRAQQSAVLQHSKTDWEDYDYFWRVSCDDGTERRIQLPIRFWAQGFVGQKLAKRAFSRFPDLGEVPEGTSSVTTILEKPEEGAPKPVDTDRVRNLSLLGEAVLVADQPGKVYRELEIPPVGPDGEVPESFFVRFDCTTGSFVVEFRKEWSFHGAERVYELVNQSFFSSSMFFRVIPGFVAQFGIAAEPMMGGMWTHQTLPDDPATLSNTRGTVTFATSGPNTRSTQLFVNMGDNARLDADGFTPVGKVVAGMGAVDAVNAEYREQPNQGMIQAMGNKYLEQNFPNLSGIVRAYFVREDARPPAPEEFEAEFVTDQGPFTVAFHRSWAPNGVDRVYHLLNLGLYDNTRFFRVAPGVLAQFGIPARQDLSRAWHKASIPDDPVVETNRRGTFVLASAGPDTRAVQAFINLGDNPDYDALGYAPLGEVVRGIEVLDKVNAEHGQQPDQARAMSEGNGYLDTFFPGLTNILTAAVVDDDTGENPDAEKAGAALDAAPSPQDAVVAGQDAET